MFEKVSKIIMGCCVASSVLGIVIWNKVRLEQQQEHKDKGKTR